MNEDLVWNWNLNLKRIMTVDEAIAQQLLLENMKLRLHV